MAVIYPEQKQHLNIRRKLILFNLRHRWGKQALIYIKVFHRDSNSYCNIQSHVHSAMSEQTFAARSLKQSDIAGNKEN